MAESDKTFLRARVSKELHKEIKRASVDDGIPIEQIVGIALEEWLERRKNKNNRINTEDTTN